MKPGIETAQFDGASVKVMRSHDYCHFEICLSSSSAVAPELVDGLRKTAARLADKAVEQYKVAKENAHFLEVDRRAREFEEERMEEMRALPETERTPEEQARLKAFDDAAWRAARKYDYEDDWVQ